MIVGIDLGTSNSLICAYTNNESILIPNEFGNYLTSSVVGVDNETILIGEIAKQRLITFPNDTISGFKRHMGSDLVIKLGDKKFTPTELSALLIKKLISDAEYFLNEKVEEAIISVPAYFNNRQRSDTETAKYAPRS